MSWKVAPIGRGGDLLYSQAGTPSLDLRFAETKSLTDYVSAQNLITFSRASSGTYVDSDGLIKTAAIDQARFDHDPATGESLGLLVEGGRTNILLNSATLATQSVTTSATAYTLSFYGTGTVTLSGTSAAGPLVGTGSGTANRATLTFTPTAGTLTLTVTGTVSNAQLEAGSFPTSYIPTTDAQATRAADVAQITGSNFSSWYNQSEGSLLSISRRLSSNSTTYATIGGSNPNVTNSISLHLISNGNALAASSGGGYIAEGSPGTGLKKYAGAYAFNNFGASINGSVNAPDTSNTVPVCDRFYFGGIFPTNGVNGYYARLTYYPVRLPDATLQTITS